MRKLLIIACAILLVASLLGCDQIKKLFGKGGGGSGETKPGEDEFSKLSPQDQAEKHYGQLKPLVENATQCLDYLYELDDNLANKTVTLDYATQRTNELKKNFALQQDALKKVNVPADFKNEWSLAQQWFTQGGQMFDLMADTIVKEKAGGGPAFQKSLDAFYAAKDRELQLFDNMTKAYDTKMASLGLNTGGGDTGTMSKGGGTPKANPKGKK
jgi:hypothetical protein